MAKQIQIFSESVKEARQIATAVKGRKSKMSAAAEIVFVYWRAATGRTDRTQYTRKRKDRIVARLQENGCDLTELLNVVDGVLTDNWIMTNGHDGILSIFRDRDQVERFFEKSPHRHKDPHPFLANGTTAS